MKKILLPVVAILFLASCSSNKWDKATVSAKLKKEMKEKAASNPLLTDEKISVICDCIADKMVAKFKSESEANKNKEAVTALSKDCAMATLMPAQ